MLILFVEFVDEEVKEVEVEKEEGEFDFWSEVKWILNWYNLVVMEVDEKLVVLYKEKECKWRGKKFNIVFCKKGFKINSKKKWVLWFFRGFIFLIFNRLIFILGLWLVLDLELVI